MRFLVIFLLFVIPWSSGSAQDLEVGVMGGGTYYLGDLNPSGHFKGMQISYGVLARYTIDSRWAVKISATRGKVKGNASSTWFLPERNLQFESSITDISAVAEFNFLPYFTGSRLNFITPYVYAGVGFFFFKPTSGGVDLQPLGTEGQQEGYEGRKPYSLTGFDVPFGLGLKVGITQKIGMAVFWEMHKTFTDYLDDVSTTYYLNGPVIDPNDPQQYLSDPTLSYEPGMQRGNSRNQDWYSFFGITITYKFALDANRRCRDVYDF
ncbi:MAG: outer membrane beta-barrel protein [Bacteroidales bacterium]|nr:outer membrane beta-barrel protein [Bacteroidales bacterium]